MAASWSWPTAAASGACASAGIRGMSRRLAFSASTRSSSCPRRRDSRRSWPSAAPRSRRFSWTRPSPPASGTGLPTRCSTRRASPPAAARGSLSRQEADRLRLAIKRVVGTAVEARLRQRPLPQELALPPSLGQKRGRGHRARRAHSPRHDRRPHDRLGPHRPALRLTCRRSRARAMRRVQLRGDARWPHGRTRVGECGAMSGPRRRKFVDPIVSRVTWHGGRGRQRSSWALLIALALPYPTLDTDSHGPSR